MRVAVLICTMNRPDELRCGLEALCMCEPRPDEILVSDDSPEMDRCTEEVCGEFSRIAYHRGPRRGLAANRNAAIAGVNSDWIHFIDDDVKVRPDFYKNAGEIIASLSEPALLSGFEQNHSPDREPRLVKPPYAGFWPHLEDAAGRSPTCVVINAALFPRELLQTTPFDERLKYGCEESDITCHALAKGYRLIVDERLVVDHYPSPANRSVYQGWLIASQVYAGLKRQWLYARNPLKAVLYLLIAVPRLVIFHFRRGGLRGGVAALKQTAQGLKYFAELLQERRSGRTLAVDPSD
ncbi:MAG: glycosyltransferase [Tepidisphaeraceae bacterium]